MQKGSSLQQRRPGPVYEKLRRQPSDQRPIFDSGPITTIQIRIRIVRGVPAGQVPLQTIRNLQFERDRREAKGDRYQEGISLDLLATAGSSRYLFGRLAGIRRSELTVSRDTLEHPDHS